MVAFLQEAAPSADRISRFLDLYVKLEARSVAHRLDPET